MRCNGRHHDLIRSGHCTYYFMYVTRLLLHYLMCREVSIFMSRNYLNVVSAVYVAHTIKSFIKGGRHYDVLIINRWLYPSR